MSHILRQTMIVGAQTEICEIILNFEVRAMGGLKH
jgi:hypothetical protein